MKLYQVCVRHSGNIKYLRTLCCTHNPPTTPKPCVRKLLIYGQIIKIVNKIFYSYLHVNFVVVCPRGAQKRPWIIASMVTEVTQNEPDFSKWFNLCWLNLVWVQTNLHRVFSRIVAEHFTICTEID